MVPGIGMFEWILIGLVALVVVGPKDLPLMFRKAGQFVGRLRGMATEFRASFDEMARQSELDELRKEVEALRRDTRAVADTLTAPVRPFAPAKPAVEPPAAAAPSADPTGAAEPPSAQAAAEEPPTAPVAAPAQPAATPTA